MNPLAHLETKYYLNIHNQWNYGVDAFEVVLDHLCSLLTGTVMERESIYSGLGSTCEFFLNDDYNPKVHSSQSDYIVMSDVENRYFNLYENAKDLLDNVLIAHPELSNLHVMNIRDVEVLCTDGQNALIEVTTLYTGA